MASTDIHPNQIRGQAVWDAVAQGDYTSSFDDLTDDLVVDNGPGAGPWRHLEGKDAFAEMAINFIGLFGDTWKQRGRCVYADDDVIISIVHETGILAATGEEFDNRAIWVSRLETHGHTNRIWTTDLAHEDLQAFWERNRFVLP